MVSRSFFVIYAAASASWLATLFISPVLGLLLSLPAAYGFMQVARDVEMWSRQRRHVSYGLAVHASRGAAVAAALVPLGTAPWLETAHPLEMWGARLVLYSMWSGLWILYYYVLRVRLEDLGVERPPALTTVALSLSILLSPLLTETLATPPEVRTALAVAMYGGFMSPLNASALLAALLTRK